MVADLKTPELVLQHNRHFFRKFCQKLRRQLHSGGTGAKGDVKMVSAAQAVPRRAFQRLTRHPAQRIFDHFFVLKEILGHFSGSLVDLGRREGA